MCGGDITLGNREKGPLERLYSKLKLIIAYCFQRKEFVVALKNCSKKNSH